MLIRNWKEYIEKVKKEYKKIGFVQCPAFNNEKVYFTRHGFRHLIRKRKYLRCINEQIERLSLLKYAPLIIGSSINFKDYNKNQLLNSKNIAPPIDFWSFMQVHNNMKIIVVVRQIKGGNKHFFSIMKR